MFLTCVISFQSVVKYVIFPWKDALSFVTFIFFKNLNKESGVFIKRDATQEEVLYSIVIQRMYIYMYSLF